MHHGTFPIAAENYSVHSRIRSRALGGRSQHVFNAASAAQLSEGRIGAVRKFYEVFSRSKVLNELFSIDIVVIRVFFEPVNRNI